MQLLHFLNVVSPKNFPQLYDCFFSSFQFAVECNCSKPVAKTSQNIFLRAAFLSGLYRLRQNSRFLETEVSRPAIRGRADDDVVEELHLQHASAFGDSARKPEVRLAGS